MQIVIDISDRIYEHISEYNKIFDSEYDYIVKAIIHGTSLPKGHGRLIDVSKLNQDIFDDNCWQCSTMESPNEGYSLKAIRNAETIVEADKEA